MEREGVAMPAMPCALVERLPTLPDPRRPGEKRKHPLVALLLLGCCGVLAGWEDVVERAKWGKGHDPFLRPCLALPPGSASHATCPRGGAVLPPAALPEVVLPWLLERRGGAGEGSHVEGKTLRGPRCQRQK